LGISVDGLFAPETEQSVRIFQESRSLSADGIVGPQTWAALPDGGPMPVLQAGSTGAIVRSLQTLLTNAAPEQWVTTPQGVDGTFGPKTRASVEAFQAWAGVSADGVVGEQTWAVSLDAMNATLESAVGFQYVMG
jgi:peptidoglycan hydrolase-like protein with peptidoglycan-binding domain